MKINIIGDNKITGSAIGENNIVQSGCSDIDWDYLQSEWLNLLSSLPNTSDEYTKSSKTLQHILNKDKHGLLTTLKEYAVTFTSTLFANAASPFLINFINSHI